MVGAGPNRRDRMVKALGDSDSGVRYWAAIALTALRPQAAPAAGALKRALDEPSPNVRFAAAGALCKLKKGTVTAMPYREEMDAFLNSSSSSHSPSSSK